jgi:hypothetical protein
MNPIKTLALGALALLSATSAWADSTIYIVASNGDRQATQQAIANRLALNGDWTFRGNSGNADRTSGTTTGLSNATGSNYGAWHGTFNSETVIIKTSFIGAAGAVAALSAADQVNNPVAKVRFAFSNGVTGTVIDLYRVSPVPVEGTDYELANATLGLSTNFQATTPYNGTYNGNVYNALDQVTVGISPLVYLASPGFPSGLNLTTQLAQRLWNVGSLPLSSFTGNWTNGDQNKIVYALGRNTDAGQRYGTYAEFGLGAQAQVKVWQPTYSTQPTTVNSIISGGIVGSHALWPAETVSGVDSPLGSGGFVTGANLAPYLTTTLGSDAYRGKYFDEDAQDFLFQYPNATAGYYIGYLTPGDALPRVLGQNNASPYTSTGNVATPGVILSWNGVAYDFDNANVKSGRYTAWVYNRILRRTSPALTGSALALYTALKAEISTVTATQGGGLIDDTNVKVKKTVDGGLVTPKS